MYTYMPIIFQFSHKTLKRADNLKNILSDLTVYTPFIHKYIYCYNL